MYLAEKRKIDVNGRIQIPSIMRDELGLKEGSEVFITFQGRKIEISAENTQENCAVCGRCLDKYMEDNK